MTNDRSCPCRPGVLTVTSTGIAPLTRKLKSARLLLSLSLVAGVMFFANVTTAFGQQLHGAGILKSCTSPVIVCDNDAECSGASGECKENKCDASGLHATSCIIRVTNLDEFGDSIQVNTAFDRITTAGGVIQNPTSGNLQIVAVSGNTTCVIGGALPCTLGTINSSVTFASSGYNPVVGDPDPLPDQGNAQVQDVCNSGVAGCNTGPQNLQFGATSDLVSGCSVVNKADSTACTDTTSGDCKTAGCESGVCVQTHGNVADSTACTSTPDVAGDCGTPGCESGVCVATHIPVADSTACSVGVTGTPSECATPGCESGVCVATHIPKSDSTACTDTTPGDCKTAGCESGICVQTHGNVADSTTCTSTSDVAGDCGTPGCESGVCVANHVSVSDSTPCSVGITGTPDECKTPGCESGVCVAAHIDKADSTACTDTTSACGFTAGCEAGSCVQEHASQACGQGCTPGFWKANADKKQSNAWPVDPNTKLGTVFTIPACLSSCSQHFANLTLRQALSLQGGNSLCEKAEILLRIATGSFLNASSSCVQFNLNAAALVAEVNGILASCDASQFITESTKLDEFNNQGCPLNQQGQCSNP
jgi:hypothetical protein